MDAVQKLIKSTLRYDFMRVVSISASSGSFWMLILLWLCMQMLQESMKKEMACSQGSYSALDLLRTSTMRTITVCLSAVWSVTQSHSVPTNIWIIPHLWRLNCNISGSQPASPTMASPWICRNLGSAFILSRSSLEQWIYQPKSWLRYPWAS